MITSKASSLILALLLAGCATTTEYVSVPLPLPEAPIYPTINGDALQCVSDAAYESLAVRDQMRKEYANELYEIIRAHNEEL